MHTESLERWHFEITQEASDYLLRLVLDGKKRATASSLWAYEIEGDPIPQAGNRSVITFWDGTPGCIVETTRVRILPYRDITFDIARLEGEDETLESWQKNHVEFFTAEGAELGYTFTEDMPVIFEEFRVLQVLSGDLHG